MKTAHNTNFQSQKERILVRKTEKIQYFLKPGNVHPFTRGFKILGIDPKKVINLLPSFHVHLLLACLEKVNFEQAKPYNLNYRIHK